MTPENFQIYLRTQQLIIESMQRIAIALELMIPHNQAPNYQFAFNKFATMDWESISAVVVDRDQDGASAILWRNNIYVRCSPSNKFGCGQK